MTTHETLAHPSMSDSRPRRRFHLVMVSGHAPPLMDGVGDCTAPLLAEIARQRPEWRYTWLTRRPGRFRTPILFGPGYRVVRPNHLWDDRGCRAACATLGKLKPDLVHVQDQIHSFFETDAAPRLAAAATCPVIATLHEYHVELPSVTSTDELVRRSSAIIANDARNADRCRERTGREPDARWWSGSTVEPPSPLVRDPEPDLVTTFGFISSLKSVEVAMQALERLRSQGRKLRWRIIGPFHPDRDPQHARLAELQKSGWVEFAGGYSVRDPKLRSLLAASRVMLLPYADGASLRRTTLHAAWAFGVPSVTTPPAHDEPALVDGENCLLVRDPSPESLAAALARVLDDPALESRLSAGGLRTAEALGWPELARRHLALYDRLLAGRSEVAVP